jgi:hypothetical protein
VQPLAVDDEISNNKLLDLPDDGLSNRSILRHERLMAELAAERAGLAIPRMLAPDNDPRRKTEEARRHFADFERLMAELRDRCDHLLIHIEEYQAQLEKRRQDIERHALHLHDGRTAYIDGDHFRDEQGMILQGRDHDEAAALHADNPRVSTWREHEVISQRISDAEAMRQKVENARAGEEPADLSDYEKDIKQQITAAAKDPTPDYGSGDYMSLSSAPAFNDAADPDTALAPAEAQTETDTATAQMKKAPRPVGQGAPKLG